MGNAVPKLPELMIAENASRDIFVELTSIKQAQNGYFGSYVLFSYCVRYKRFTWNISLRFNELISIDRRLQIEFPHNAQLKAMQRPEKFNKIMWLHTDKFLESRGKIMLKYIQELLDIPSILQTSRQLRRFLNLSDNSLSPDNGRKGMESFMVKSSGGYFEKFSRTSGDYFTLWRNRWIVITDTCISWYRTPEDRIASGTLLIDQGFHFVVKNRIIVLFTETRKILLQAATKRLADQWVEELNSFYTNSTRITPQPFGSFKAVRTNCHVKVYTVPRDYYSAVAVALLSAQKEILITGWKNSPCVVLTRPPLPTLRLDQILKYKAEQGVKIFILLYKEVEYVGQGNDSGLARAYLTGLHKNIHCIRHPNKFIGGSTAVLWSHHEKTVVIDRNLAFVGGIDLAYQRWDDEKHRAADEDGIIYPGKDYRQPAPALFKPARKIVVQKKNSKFEDEDDEMIIERDSDSESAASPKPKIYDDDNELVDEVVDFGHVTPTKEKLYKSQDANSPGVVASPSPDGLSAIVEEGAGEDEANDQGETLSVISKNHMEDKLMGDTEEEEATKKELVRAMEVKRLKKNDKQVHVQSQDDDDDDLSLAESDRVADTRDRPRRESFARTAKTHDSAASLASTGSYFYDNMLQGLSNAKSSLLDSAEFVKQQIKSYKDPKGNLHTSSSQIEIRDFYPRMGWHDVQAAVNGAPARDVASHFVQRWNHHRSSTSQLSEPILRDITDNLYFTSCARCKLSGILETVVTCPNCHYDLGPCNSYSNAISPSLFPTPIAEHSYIVFEVAYGITFPFKMGGDCPVIITSILDSGGALTRANMVSREIVEAHCKPRLVEAVGPYADHIVSRTSNNILTAEVGDIVYKVDEVEVTHLDCLKVKRFLKKRVSARKKELTIQTTVKPIIVTYRRHFLGQVYSDDKSKFSAEEHKQPMLTHPANAENSNTDTGNHSNSSMSTQPPVTTIVSHHDRGESSLHPVVANVLKSITTHTDPAISSNGMHPVLAPILAIPTAITSHQRGNSMEDAYNIICQAVAQKELLLNMSLLAHRGAATLDLAPRLFDGTGTCHVQVLRSVGKWSIGTKTECSIMNCWIESIRSAQHLVYIENQFFIGNLAGDDVVNGVPLAIADRILQAHTQKQRFRVIVVIPMHPNGDYAGALKSKLVLHYELMTICKGMFTMLKHKAPDINITDYITFHSLKSWGIINNKVVSDQVYVHDKLLIVDDRVCVIGSANINDRSMMGNRDSEMAIRIEDTAHETITLDNKPFVVGSLPHRVRLRLMHQHLADETIDIVDVLNESIFFNNWRKISNSNSAIYDELDGDTSMYRVTRIVDFYTALAKYENKSALDPDVMTSVKEIKGFLVDWPYTLLQNEDLSPTLATRAVIPNELWV